MALLSCPSQEEDQSISENFWSHQRYKVGTPLGMDVMDPSFLLPSSGTFRSDILDKVTIPMLHFLNQT